MLGGCGLGTGGRGCCGGIWRVVIEIAVLDGHDIFRVELIFVVFAIVEAEDAALEANLFDTLLRLEDLICLDVTFDDGDLVLFVVAIGEGSCRDRRS